MKTLTLKLSRPSAQKYQLFVGDSAISALPGFVKSVSSVSRCVIIADSRVARTCGKSVLSVLQKSDLPAEIITFPAGESSKSEEMHQKLTHALLKKKYGRDTLVIALGGGVTGDLAGYVAATYMRGIPYVQIPTSFLGMVDSSLGGKVAVNTPYGKNMVGAFWHPLAVFADTSFLKSLAPEQLRSGLMESAKIFLTYDKSMFAYFCKNFSQLMAKNFIALEKVILRSMELKIGVIIRDERDQNERMVVNFGHSVGHAIEHLSRYKLPHGICVALGILVESKASQLIGVLSEKDFQCVVDSFVAFGIDVNLLRKFSPESVMESMGMDKKNQRGNTRLILLERIGKVRKTRGLFGHTIQSSTIRAAIEFFAL